MIQLLLQQLLTINMSSEKGFTLPELMVSLAIIAILVGLVGGNLANDNQNQKERELRAHREMISDALQQCYALEGGYPRPTDYATKTSWDLVNDTNANAVKKHFEDSYHIIFTDQYVYTYKQNGSVYTIELSFKSP